MLELWLAETTGYSSASIQHYGHGQENGPFPASSIETTVGKVLMSLASGSGSGLGSSGQNVASDVTARLQEVQRELRRRF